MQEWKIPDWLEPTRSHDKTKLFCKVAISYEYVQYIWFAKKHHKKNKINKELAWRSTPEPNLQWEISRLYEKVQMWLYDFIQINHKFVKIFFLAPESLRVGFLSSANGKWKPGVDLKHSDYRIQKEGEIAVAPITTCSSPFDG